MARDYAHRSRGKQAKKQKGFPWIALVLLVIMIVLVVVGWIYLRRTVQSHKISTEQAGAAVVTAAKAVPEEPKKVTEPSIKFDFYQQLPKLQVPVSDANSDAAAVQRPYLIQLASLNDEVSARDFQEQLLEKGVTTHVTPVVQGSRTIYRVQQGPFADQTTAQAAHDQLQAKNISSILVAVG